jgi:hypothetical protein
MISHHQLAGYLGKSIGDICQNGYTSVHENHCAHFVSHVLGYRFGATCQMMGNGKGDPATLRVHELFSRCGRRLSERAWCSSPARPTSIS